MEAMMDERRKLEQEATEVLKAYALWWRERSGVEDGPFMRMLAAGRALIEYDSRPEWNVDERDPLTLSTENGDRVWANSVALRDRVLAFLNSPEGKQKG